MAGAGNDVLTGNGGTDTVTYPSVTGGGGVTVNLSTTTQQNTVNAGLDTITGIENLTGSANDDTLTGNSSGNTIDGGAGNDSIDGGAGNDTIQGGAGNDTLNGGTDFDVASYAGVDRVTRPPGSGPA